MICSNRMSIEWAQVVPLRRKDKGSMMKWEIQRMCTRMRRLWITICTYTLVVGVRLTSLGADQGRMIVG